MNRRHDRRVDQSREGVGGEVRLIVNQIELVGLFEEVGQVAEFPDLRVDRCIVPIRCRHDAIERSAS